MNCATVTGSASSAIEGRDPQQGPRAALQVAARLAQRIDPLLDLRDLGKQGMRVLGRHEPSPGPVEQREAEQRFGVAQDFRHRWLRDVEHPRRGADRAVDVDRVEDFDMAQVHRPATMADAGRHAKLQSRAKEG
jgi:hypothetical protein